MGVYKKNNSWFLDYRANGRRIREKVGPSKTLAEQALRKRLTEIAEGKFLDKRKEEKLTFKDFASHYLETYSKPNKRSWKSSDQNSLRNLVPFFGNRYLYEITTSMIEKYKTERRTAVSAASVNRELACLKCMLNRAVDWSHLQENPAKKVKLFKEDNGRVRYLEPEELAKLLKECSGKLRDIILFAANTGARLGEIQSLRWSNTDFERGLVCFDQTKNGERRYVPMNTAVREALLRTKKHPESPLVFCSSTGGTLYFRKAFSRAIKAAGIKDFRFHDLRHTFASQLVMGGVDLNTVRELLGHKTLAMTLRYSHLSKDHKTRAVEVLSHRMDTFRTPSEEKGAASENEAAATIGVSA